MTEAQTKAETEAKTEAKTPRLKKGGAPQVFSPSNPNPAIDYITVEFRQDYCAQRGPGIIGAEGAIKRYPRSYVPKELFDAADDRPAILKLIKKGAAARETATSPKGETS